MEANSNNKLIWFLWANPTQTASSRIQGQVVHNKLKELGYASGIAYHPTSFENEIPLLPFIKNSFPSLVNAGDIVIIQKCKDITNLPAIEYFKSLELKVVLVDCDLPISKEIGKAVDLVICSSQMLCSAYAQLGIQSCFIEDTPEWYYERTSFTDKKKFTCVWFGDGSDQKWTDVKKLKTILSDSRLSRWQLITISNHPDATIAWQSDYLQTISQQADVIALPVFNRDEASAVKSANRLLQSMALSLPTICSPILSYQHIADCEQGIIICDAHEEWIQAFLLMEDSATRTKFSTQAFLSAQKYSLDVCIKQWIEALQLNENFKTTHTTEKIMYSISILFYIELIKKNILYFLRVPLSLRSITSALYYFYNRTLRIFSK